MQQKSQELLLRRREQQLAEREIDVLERELNVLIFQLSQEAPHVKKRKGRFRRGRLRLKDGHRISLPSGLCLQDRGDRSWVLSLRLNICLSAWSVRDGCLDSPKRQTAGHVCEGISILTGKAHPSCE